MRMKNEKEIETAPAAASRETTLKTVSKPGAAAEAAAQAAASWLITCCIFIFNF